MNIGRKINAAERRLALFHTASDISDQISISETHSDVVIYPDLLRFFTRIWACADTSRLLSLLQQVMSECAKLCWPSYTRAVNVYTYLLLLYGNIVLYLLYIFEVVIQVGRQVGHQQIPRHLQLDVVHLACRRVHGHIRHVTLRRKW